MFNISTIDSSKNGVELAKIELISQLQQSPENPLGQYRIARTLEKVSLQALDDLKDEAIAYARLHYNSVFYNGKEFVDNGQRYRIKIQNTYNYANNDITETGFDENGNEQKIKLWASKQKAIDALKAEMKQLREEQKVVEARIRMEHPRMLPSSTDVSISYQGVVEEAPANA